MNYKNYFLILTTICLSACQLNTEASFSTGLPEVEVECRLGDSSACVSANSGKSLWLGLSEDLNFDCPSEMNSFTIGQFERYFEAYNQTPVSFDGAKITAEVTQWLNENNQAIYILSASEFTLCAFIDLNDNERLDSNEPYAQTTSNETTSFVLLDEWFEF